MSVVLEGELDEKLDFMPEVVEVDAPKLSDIPVRVQQILCLLACQFSLNSIAVLAGISKESVKSMVVRYDPQRRFSLSPNERKRFLRDILQSRALEAALHISPEKLEASTAAELSGIAGKAASVAHKMVVTEEEDRKSPYEVLEALGAPALEAHEPPSVR